MIYSAHFGLDGKPLEGLVVELAHQDFGALVRFYGDCYLLWWTDYVANEWQEYLPDKELAVRRLRHLAQAVVRGQMMQPLEAWLASQNRSHD